MAGTAVASAVDGAKEMVSPAGIGAIAVVFAVLAVLAYFAITPSSVAADVREQVGG